MNGPAPTDHDDPSARLLVGSRVVVRQTLHDDPEASATDVVGTLRVRTDDFLLIDTKNGRVAVPRADVILAKDVPPAASRPGPAHLRVSATDLSLLIARGWVPTESDGLGGWLLRSAPGFTGRANSVLPIGDPTLPLDKAIDYCERWYAERDQDPLFQIVGEKGFELATDPVAAALLERGYTTRTRGLQHGGWERVHVMTAPSSGVPPLTEQSVPVVGDARLQPEWLLTYGIDHKVVPGVTETVLTGGDGQLFLSINDPEDPKKTVAIARMAIHPGWAGLYGMWVHPDHRRKGYATTLLSTIAMVGRDNHMPSIYLQVTDSNTEAIDLYESLGFTTHHEYIYLSRRTD